MLIEARELQDRAVKQLLQVVKDRTGRGIKEITFKAPTGSGKTFMMADFCNRILNEQDDVIFLISSLSKGDLAQQNYDKFNEYVSKRFFNKLQPFLISSETSGEERLHIPDDKNVYFLPRDKYKEKALLHDQGTLEAFLQQMTKYNGMYDKSGTKQKKVYFIRDESHIATNKIEDKLFKYFEVVINFSATPKLSRGQIADVEVKEEDAINCKLIKHIEQPDEDKPDDEKDTLEDVIKKFEEIKEQYLNLLHINPCLIIQISNKDEGEAELEKIKAVLQQHEALKWMYIVNEDKKCDTNDRIKKANLPVSKWKEYCKQNTSTIDVIIFKMVITEGWDIPRACMLYQIRDSKSKQLDEQVLGRVRRNPCLLNFDKLSQEAQELALKAFVWGIIPQELKKFIPVVLRDGVAEKFKIKTTKLTKLIKRKDFDLEKFLEKQEHNTTNISGLNKSIFELRKNILKTTNEAQDVVENYSNDYDNWWKISKYVKDIDNEITAFEENYEESMEISDEVSFSKTSHITSSDRYVRIKDWIWKRKDDQNDFYFDSIAEKKFAELLDDISQNISKKQTELYDEISLFGKNFTQNSKISFEYYDFGIHRSYPDFIAKDNNGIIHIFEVKSVNKSGNSFINEDEYNNKVNQLEKCYKFASKKTNQVFYLPILDREHWKIIQYKNGEEKNITKDYFISQFCNNF